MKYCFPASLFVVALIFAACNAVDEETVNRMIPLGSGQMPNASHDKNGALHLVFGNGDSILYTASEKGKSFLSRELVAVLPELNASHMRGPQIASTVNGTTIIACNSQGNIYSYKKLASSGWRQSGRVNDVDTTAKEGLMALSGEGEMLYAVWLDLRDGHNKLFGARSKDGGQTWSKNILVYASPDTTVCECCKPSVIVKGDQVYVMFRNWLNGNRDLYLTESADGGQTFNNAQKLGNGAWALNGCPMDGGGMVLNDGQVQTVWNRKGKIYACQPGGAEVEIGEGRSCATESVGDQVVYAWTEKGEIICLLPKMKVSVGTGNGPVIKAINDEQVVCIWEKGNQIYSKILNL